MQSINPDLNTRYKVQGFPHNRQYPGLPPKYTWDGQKQSYCPRNLQIKSASGKFELKNKYGYVFSHRGLYERASGIIDNSFAAIANGTSQGLFLHEVDAIVLDRLDRAFIAHELHPKRIANLDEIWDAYSFHQIVTTGLVIRGVKTGPVSRKQAHDGGHLSSSPSPDARIQHATDAEEMPSHTAFASTYLNAEGDIPGLLEMLWNETRNPVGRTLQIDFRNKDFAKAIPYYSFHISKTQFPTSENSRGLQHTLAWKMFESTMLKGYNCNFKSFDALYVEIERESNKTYGRNCFKLQHLHLFPPLMMVFYADPIVDLAKNTRPANPLWGRRSYEHIYSVCLKQIESFVGIDTGVPGMPYSFILEICHSGLGLRYDRAKNIARNPLDDELLVDEKVIFESLVDRVMIDVSLKLREEHPDLLFSSCTRLPDVITTEGAYKASFQDAELRRFEDGEAGLSAKLRALPGGLYPPSHLVVADDPTAEIAARTWMDEEGEMDRSRLMDMSYEQWITTCASPEVRAGLLALNQHGFLANRFVPEKPLERKRDAIDKVTNWKRDLQFPMESPNEEPATATNSWSAYKAASRGEEGRLRVLIARRVSLNDSTGRYGTPLAVASAKGHGAIVQLLLDAGADVTFEQKWGSSSEIASLYGSPLELASYYGHGHIVEILLKRLGAEMDLTHQATKNQYIRAALHQASEQGHEEVVRQLLHAGADMGSLGNRYQATALQIASSRGHVSIVEALLNNNANVNAHGTRHCTALRAACRHGHVGVAQLLLHHGAIVDFPLETWFSQEIRTLLQTSGNRSAPGPCTGPTTEPSLTPEQHIPGELRFDNLSWLAKHGFDITPLVDTMKSNGWPRRNPRWHLSNLSHPPDHYKVVARGEEKRRRRREEEVLKRIKNWTAGLTNVETPTKYHLKQKRQRVERRLESCCGCLLCVFDKQAHESFEGRVQAYNTELADPVAFTLKQMRDRCLSEERVRLEAEVK